MDATGDGFISCNGTGWRIEVTAAAAKQQMVAGSLAHEDNVLTVHRMSRLSAARLKCHRLVYSGLYYVRVVLADRSAYKSTHKGYLPCI